MLWGTYGRLWTPFDGGLRQARKKGLERYGAIGAVPTPERHNDSGGLSASHSKGGRIYKVHIPQRGYVLCSCALYGKCSLQMFGVGTW